MSKRNLDPPPGKIACILLTKSLVCSTLRPGSQYDSIGWGWIYKLICDHEPCQDQDKRNGRHHADTQRTTLPTARQGCEYIRSMPAVCHTHISLLTELVSKEIRIRMRPSSSPKALEYSTFP